METNEWFYGELLDLLKKKEKEKEESYYRPIELELPLVEPPPTSIGDEKINDEATEERGVIVIEF